MFFSQSLHAMESHVMIKFLPTTLNQLFRVLTSATQEDVAVNVTRQVSLRRSLIWQQLKINFMYIMINTLTGEYLTLSIYLYAREPLKATFDVKFVDFTIIF